MSDKDDLVYDGGKLRPCTPEDRFPEWSDESQEYAGFHQHDSGDGWEIYVGGLGQEGRWIVSYGPLSIQNILITDPLVVIDLHFKLSVTDIASRCDAQGLADLIANVRHHLPAAEGLVRITHRK